MVLKVDFTGSVIALSLFTVSVHEYNRNMASDARRFLDIEAEQDNSDSDDFEEDEPFDSLIDDEPEEDGNNPTTPTFNIEDTEELTFIHYLQARYIDKMLLQPAQETQDQSRLKDPNRQEAGGVSGKIWMKEKMKEIRFESHEFVVGEWVRLRSGRYKGDVALVVEKRGNKYHVLLFPRLDDPNEEFKSRKRKRGRTRPLPALFQPRLFRKCTPVDVDASHYAFEGNTFVHGLFSTTFTKTRLESTTTISPRLEAAFSHSNHPLVKQSTMPHSEDWLFAVGEKILPSKPSLSHAPSSFVCLDPRLDHTVPQLCTVSFSDSEFGLPVRHACKAIEPGDFVHILMGFHAGKEGLVFSSQGGILEVVEENVPRTRFKVHANSTEVIISTNADTPWVGATVSVQRGPHTLRRCVVKDVVRQEQREGRRLMLSVYVLDMRCHTFLNNNNVVEWSSQMKLVDWRPLTEVQQQIYGVESTMSVGREPWLGTRVMVIGPQFKGVTSAICGVLLDRSANPKSGLHLRVELDLFQAHRTQAIEVVDYLHVVELISKKHLNVWQPLGHSHEFWLPREGLKNPFNAIAAIAAIDAKDILPDPELPALEDLIRMYREGDESWRGLLLPDPPRTPPGTPLPSPNKTTEMLETGDDAWNPSARSPVRNETGDFAPWDPNWNALATSTSAVDPVVIDNSEVVAAPPRHWIVHPRLAGLDVEAAVDGTDAYVTVVRNPTGDVVPCIKVNAGSQDVSDLSRIKRSSDTIKPSTEKNLMVVIDVTSEHVGKLVHRLSNFYLGEKSEDKHWIVIGVVEKVSETGGKRLTEERLELDLRHDLARVKESMKDRTKANEIMKPVRDAILKQNGRKTKVRPVS